ncbi:MAG: hypothetical protein JW955_19915 [Sedimentisphaerales bacterium]|nr:hypothetical protein [Sedimentisphaerales bacterium]
MKTKEDKTYHYVIEERIKLSPRPSTPVALQWTLLSDDDYSEADSIRLRQDSPEVIPSADDEQAVIAFPKEVYGEIIEKQLVREGGVINGATVVKIHKDTVEFEKDGKRWTRQKGDDGISYR